MSRSRVPCRRALRSSLYGEFGIRQEYGLTLGRMFHNVEFVGDAPDVGLGPGWEVIKVHGKTFFMHTGMDPGVFTLGYFDPSARSGVIIFTNSSNGPHIILPLLKLLNADPDFIAYLAAQV